MQYFVKDGEDIILYDSDLEQIKITLEFLPQYANFQIQQTERKIIELDGKFFFEDDVKDIIEEREKQKERKKIEDELKALDEKRIRAVCEPSMKDDEMTWLEYYNQEVVKLRDKLKNI